MELRIYCARRVEVPQFRILIIKNTGDSSATIIAPSRFPPKKDTVLLGTNVRYSMEGFTPKRKTLPAPIRHALASRWSEIAPLVEPNTRLDRFSAIIDVTIV